MDKTLTLLNNKKQEYISVFSYGSRVYGTQREDSDYDYIVIKGQTSVADKAIEDHDFHFFSEEEFLQRLEEHELSALECLWLPQDMSWGQKFSTEIDKSKLRKSISAKASNSWVKSKKKLEVEKEYLIGKKSLFHSFRILLFGTQIAVHGKIVDYTAGREFYEGIVLNECNDWQFYYDKYKKVHNKIASEFKKVAPK